MAKFGAWLEAHMWKHCKYKTYENKRRSISFVTGTPTQKGRRSNCRLPSPPRNSRIPHHRRHGLDDQFGLLKRQTVIALFRLDQNRPGNARNHLTV